VRKGKGIKYREINGLRCEERKRNKISGNEWVEM